jgi:hypothetical protein
MAMGAEQQLHSWETLRERLEKALGGNLAPPYHPEEVVGYHSDLVDYLTTVSREFYVDQLRYMVPPKYADEWEYVVCEGIPLTHLGDTLYMDQRDGALYTATTFADGMEETPQCEKMLRSAHTLRSHLEVTIIGLEYLARMRHLMSQQLGGAIPFLGRPAYAVQLTIE